MPLHVAVQSGATVSALIEEMNRTGFGCLTDYVGAADLARMKRFVSDAVAKAGHSYVGFTGPEAMRGSSLDELSVTPAFRALMDALYEAGTGQRSPGTAFHQVLRCLAGRSGRSHSLVFHYDSYAVTALIPIEIPTEGRAGDLLMLPNMRRIRTSYAANVVDKLLLDNSVTQFALRHLTARNLVPVTRIKMTPGSAYFFWGYRSIHANEVCDVDKVRATALFHYVNPHAGSRYGFGLRERLGRAAA